MEAILNRVGAYSFHEVAVIRSPLILALNSLFFFVRDDFDLMRKFMVPWNVNVLAGDYLSVCMKNKEYMQQTWDITGQLRRTQKQQLQTEFPHWDVKGEAFLSWMWIDTKSEQVVTCSNINQSKKLHKIGP